MRLPPSASCVFALVLFGSGCLGSEEPLGASTSVTNEESSTSTSTETETETETEGGGETETSGEEPETGDGDGDPSTGDGDGDDTSEENCWDAPQQCLDFIECIGVVLPDQYETVVAAYGEGGSCWCNNTEDNAQACFETCVVELQAAIEAYPTANECHESYCGLDELDSEQPYGKPDNGSCPNWGQSPQLAIDNPFGVPGSVCAPQCSGIANYCPEHSQTAADGTCLIQVGNDAHCLNRCWVDHTVVGGTQCQCGATCQPYGGPDGEGNLRGICTFE